MEIHVKIRIMKARKIFMFSVAVALLFASCSKDNDGRLRIFAENMTGGSSAKIWVNPSSVSTASSSATWVVDESINLNGTAYAIARNGEAEYYLNTNDDLKDMASSLLAVYPASTSADGNDVTVTNNGSTGTVTIRSLCVDYRDGGHRILFPMAASNNKSDMRLLFKHLTAGMKLTLTNNSGSIKTIGSLKIVTYGEGSAAGALGAVNGVSCSWMHQGPVLPGGEIGSITGNQSVGYASEMHFTIRNDGSAGKAVDNGSSIGLCVPLTINKITKIEITGYDTDGAQLFFKTKSVSALAVTANEMYTIPEIQF